MNHAILEFLHQRRSVPSRLLGSPGPDDAQLRELLRAATCVPDHGRLAPWRFIRISGESSDAFGKQLVEIYRTEHPDATAAALEKEESRFKHPPVVVVVVAKITHPHKIPEIEQRLSGGAVCMQLLQAAHATGYAAQWLTGWAAYHPDIGKALHLAAQEEILGFIHIGTPQGDPPAYTRPDIDSLLTDWRA